MAEFEAGPDGFARRHYEAIAARIANYAGLSDCGCMRDLAEDLADLFESGNPRFSRARFLKACGVAS